MSRAVSDAHPRLCGQVIPPWVKGVTGMASALFYRTERMNPRGTTPSAWYRWMSSNDRDLSISLTRV
jgi:hypothetical protein